MSQLLRQACSPAATACGMSLMRAAFPARGAVPDALASLGLNAHWTASATFSGSSVRSFAADAAGSAKDKDKASPTSFRVGVPSREDAAEGGHAGRTFADGYIAPFKGMKDDMRVQRPFQPPQSAAAAAPAAPEHEQESFMPHPVYGDEYVESVRPKHVQPQSVRQHIGSMVSRIMRVSFDLFTGYSKKSGAMTESQWLRRMIFLETVAGVPGMVGGMLRHLRSLRSMKKDGGWIHSLLEEAENERMHLLTFMQLRQPGLFFRTFVIVAQGVFFNAYFVAYVLSPKTAHAFVGYLEEEAVKTYTHAIEEIDAGRLWKDRLAPPIAVQYWNLRKDATMRDLILAVRADEACHSHVNHVLSQRELDAPNPFAKDTQHTLP